ncbi:MAG: 4Fe-4S binding protein [Candidatus Omnitrophica bacterium]|nr:4Fe-4S binding protein [Candidatus Omnitrophota bacterium]
MLNIHPFRRVTQIFGVLITNAYLVVAFRCSIYTGAFKSVCLPFLYCHSCPSAGFACPIGVMQHYSAIHRFPFFLVGHLMLIGVLVGRMVCGWVCPVGLAQELLYKIKSPKIKLPKELWVLPFIMLIVFAIILPYITTEHWFSKLCPVGMVVAGIPWVVWNPVNPITGEPTILPGTVGWLFLLKIFILIVVLVLVVISKRPFCKYICPLGLFWGFFNRASIMKLEVLPTCTKCDTCNDICPEGIVVYEEPNSGECVRCMECLKCQHVKLVNTLGREKSEPGPEVKTEGKA